MFLLQKAEVDCYECYFRCGRGSLRLSQRSLDSALMSTAGDGRRDKRMSRVSIFFFFLDRLQERDSLPSAALQLCYWSLSLLQGPEWQAVGSRQQAVGNRQQAPTCAGVFKPAAQLKTCFFKV